MAFKPLISVILPTYNRLQYLPETVETILNQTFTDFELIIIDDGSTDGTKEWINKQADCRIRYINYTENRGVSYARNMGLDLVQGKYIAFCDSDDLNESTRFEEQVNVLEADEELVVCGSNIGVFGLHNQVWRYKGKPLPFRVKALFQIPFHFPASMVRRSFLEKEKIRFRAEIQSADDYYFLMRVVSKGKAIVVQKPLYHYRQHASSISFEQTREQKENAIAISQIAFKDILQYHLKTREAAHLYDFIRDIAKPKDQAFTFQTVDKIINFTKQSTGLTNEEKESLISFLERKKTRFNKRWYKLLLFLKKKAIYVRYNFLSLLR